MRHYAHTEKFRIRSKYTPGIHLLVSLDKSFRTMHVTAKAREGRRLVVRTRAGYYAPLKSQPLPTSGQFHEDPN